MYTLKKIFPHIWHLKFDTAYNTAMHFLRVQEYYESPKYHKRIFTLVDYMEWYSKEHGGGAFTYANDWSGFNTPGWAVKGVYQLGDLPDQNKYDDTMYDIYVQILSVENDDPFFYLIGTSEEDSEEEEVLDHELAHAFYAVDNLYRFHANSLLFEEIPEPAYIRATRILAGMGHHPSVIDDEIHAYCATGLCEELERKISKKATKPFQKLFKQKLDLLRRGTREA